MIDVCLLGTGGMFPLPERALTALYVRYQSNAILIDCGEGTQTAMRSAALRFKSIDAILITHFHADHISGLPGLLLTIGNEGRTEPLHLYGPEGLEGVVNSLRAIVPELPFELRFHEFTWGVTEKFSCAGLELTVFPANHGIPCLGYRLELNRPGKFDPVKAREKGIPQRLWKYLQKGEAMEGFAPEDVLGPPRKGLRILYSTDSRPVADMEELGKDADLMILEGMFGDPEKQARAEESHHMMMQEAATLAAKTQAKELWLTHFSPANMNPEEYAKDVQSIFANTIIGKGGLKKTLVFTD